MSARAVAVCVLGMSVVGGDPSINQQATFRSGAEAVLVDVSVTRRGRPVEGLELGDFEVFDNGERQQLALVDVGQAPVDLVLALDASESVTGERRAHLQRASQALLGALTDRDRAGLVTFSHEVTVVSPLTADFASLTRFFASASPGGRTALIDAAFTSMTLAEAGDGRALVIVLSDGLDTASWLSAAHVRDVARRLEVVLVGVTTGSTDRVIEDLADATGGDILRVESRNIDAALASVVRSFRQRYLLSFTPRSPSPGWHRLEVRVKRRGLSVRAREGYFSAERP